MIANLLALLAPESRRAIVVELSKGPKDVASLAVKLGLAPSTVDEHLLQLQEHGLVASETNEGQQRYRLDVCVNVVQGRHTVHLTVTTDEGDLMTLETKIRHGSPHTQ